MPILKPIKKIETVSKTSQLNYVLLISAAVMMLGGAMPAQAIVVTSAQKIFVKNNTHFNNFDKRTLKVNIPAYAMVGEYRFLKISDTNGDVLFLGKVAPNEIFSLPVHKLKSAKKLTIEIFSENAADEQIILVTK